MSEKRKNCLLLAAVILLVAGLAVTGILLPDQQISLTERRSLAQLPTVSVSLVLDKSFSEAFDSYSQDQFPFQGMVPPGAGLDEPVGVPPAG